METRLEQLDELADGVGQALLVAAMLALGALVRLVEVVLAQARVLVQLLAAHAAPVRLALLELERARRWRGCGCGGRSRSRRRACILLFGHQC